MAEATAVPLTESITATGRTAWIRAPKGKGSLIFYSITGTCSATIAPQFSPDGGTTWYNIGSTSHVSSSAFTIANNLEVTYPLVYALNCSAYTSGTATVVMSAEPA